MPFFVNQETTTPESARFFVGASYQEKSITFTRTGTHSSNTVAEMTEKINLYPIQKRLILLAYGFCRLSNGFEFFSRVCHGSKKSPHPSPTYRFVVFFLLIVSGTLSL